MESGSAIFGLATIDGWRIPNPAILLILQSVADLGLLSGGVPAARQGSSGTDSAFYLKERSSLLKQSACAIEHYPRSALLRDSQHACALHGD